MRITILDTIFCASISQIEQHLDPIFPLSFPFKGLTIYSDILPERDFPFTLCSVFPLFYGNFRRLYNSNPSLSVNRKALSRLGFKAFSMLIFPGFPFSFPFTDSKPLL